MGVDCVSCPQSVKRQIWQKIAGPWKLDHLEDMVTEVSLEQLSEKIDQIFELTRHISKEAFLKKNAYLKDKTFIKSSDAHCIDLVGDVYTEFLLKEASFNEVKMALRNEEGRTVNLLK